MEKKTYALLILPFENTNFAGKFDFDATEEQIYRHSKKELKVTTKN